MSGVGDGFCDTDNNNALCGKRFKRSNRRYIADLLLDVATVYVYMYARGVATKILSLEIEMT